MHNNRRYTRYMLGGMELNGRIIFADKLEIIDISCGGIAIKVDRRLAMECEYLLRLYNNHKHISVKGTVVRSSLVGSEERSDGKTVLIYTAGLRFTEDAADLISDFLGQSSYAETGVGFVSENNRLHVRFYIKTPWRSVLHFPAQYHVKVIGLGGMMIETEHAFEIESRLPMELSFNTQDSISFEGRVASCLHITDKEPACHEVGIEFQDLTDEDRKVLAGFIDYLSIAASQ